MDEIFIFGAKYLFLLSVVITGVVFLKSSREEFKRMALFFILSLGLTFILSLLARALYFNPRPFVVGDFTPLIPHAADNGFPSDHTLLAAGLAAGMMFFRKRISYVLWLIAGAVAVSRVYVGVHHPADVLGAGAIALLGAGIVYVFLKRRDNATITGIK